MFYKIILFLVFIIALITGVACSGEINASVTINFNDHIKDDRIVIVESFTNILREKFVQGVTFGGAGGLGLAAGAPEVIVDKTTFINLSENVTVIYSWESALSNWPDFPEAKNVYEFNWAYMLMSGEVVRYTVSYSIGDDYCLLDRKENEVLYFSSNVVNSDYGCPRNNVGLS